VAALRAELDAELALSASVLHSRLHEDVAALRDSVIAMLQDMADTRSEDAAAWREVRTQQFQQLREQVSARLSELSAERDERTASQWDELRLARQTRTRDVANMLGAQRAQRPATHKEALPTAPASAQAAPTAEGSSLMQRLGQVGLITYAQMTRVAILRTLETGALGDAQERQIGAHIEGLTSNVQPFLTETLLALGQLKTAERGQLAEIVEGVRRNVVALHDELELAPWPTGPSQRQVFSRLVEHLRHRLAPLRAELDAAIQALQSGQEPSAGRPRSQPEPEAETPQARSYRDNLTTIHGIGPALQQRLDRAGICTYIQLALSSPEELRKALGEAGRLANVEDWIVQARSLAGMPS
jgi:predicted flap endonuclease-1-like 5' DNA nuclease